jgi:hypothetical protein
MGPIQVGDQRLLHCHLLPLRDACPGGEDPGTCAPFILVHIYLVLMMNDSAIMWDYSS